MAHMRDLSSEDGETMYILLKALVPPIDARCETFTLWKTSVETGELLGEILDGEFQRSARFLGLWSGLATGLEWAGVAEESIRAAKAVSTGSQDTVSWGSVDPHDTMYIPFWLIASPSDRAVALVDSLLQEPLQIFQTVFNWRTDNARYQQHCRALKALTYSREWVRMQHVDAQLPKPILDAIQSGHTKSKSLRFADNPLAAALYRLRRDCHEQAV